MPIQEQNIQFLESQVMDDVPEGGGAATGRVIPDGQMNNVFEDISDLDRALGRFNLRKVFLGVRALNTDLYGGAKIAVTGLPNDAAIGYTVFTTHDAFDTRANAQNRVESYLFKGPMWPGVLQSNHLQGMAAINVIQRPETRLPPIGKTLCLVENEGASNQKEQYVRVTNVDVTPTVFSDAKGDYPRWVIRLDLSDPLRFDFNGHEPNREDNYSYSNRVRLRDTVVADAQRYYGAQTLRNPGAIGDLQIRVSSQFARLVPAARTETPLVNQPLNPNLMRSIVAGTRTVQVPQQAHTRAVAVTAENRRLNWVELLLPRPAPNTLSMAYMAQGNWYELRDNGTGALAGDDPGWGAGTVNYVTGDVSITLGALPDAGGQIIYTWASPVHYERRDGDPEIPTGFEVFHELGEPIKPGTLVLTWLRAGQVRTATAALSGHISGDATGYCSHVSGEFRLEFTQPPDFNSLMGIDYQRQTVEQMKFTGVTPSGGLATLSIGQAIEPGTLEARWVTQSTRRWSSSYSYISYQWNQNNTAFVASHKQTVKGGGSSRARLYRQANDNGAGLIATAAGVVNYETGQFSLPILPDFPERAYEHNGEWSSYSSSTHHEFVTGVVDVWFTPAGAAATFISTEVPLPALTFRVLPRLLTGDVVPGSVRFTFGGQTYDDVMGTIFRASDGLAVGSIDYDSGFVTLTHWSNGATGNIVVTSLLVRWGQWHTDEFFFRSALSPLAPEALTVTGVTMTGTQVVGTADADGVFQGTGVANGAVHYDFGVARIQFADPVDPGSVYYNAVAYKYVPLPASILGVDAVRLPADGRVPIYRAGDVLLIMHPLTTAPVTPVPGVPVSLGRTRIGWVRVIDSTGATVYDGYDLDRANGTVTFATLPPNPPVTIRHTVADLRLCTDAQISGHLTLARELTHPYPANETIVASCLLFGDRRARLSHFWTQVSWDGTWQDSIKGSAATATLNLIDFPIQVTNEGTDTDRWIFRCNTASTHSWELISQRRGRVWIGTYAPGGADVAPINPRTRTWDEDTQTWIGGVPYMRIPGMANGGGWANGNVIRINTVGAIADFWIARAVAQSDEPLDDGADGCEIYALGNIDRP